MGRLTFLSGGHEYYRNIIVLKEVRITNIEQSFHFTFLKFTPFGYFFKRKVASQFYLQGNEI